MKVQTSSTMERATTSNSFKADPALDQQLNNNKNPLLNPVVLKNLFGLIPFKLEEFKNFRLVSHEWNDCAVHFVHQNSWLKLNGIAETIFHNDENFRLHVSVLNSITSCLEESQELSSLLKGTIRFKKYLISNQVHRRINARGLINFWEKFGPRMTHLEISDSTMHAQDLSRIIFELTPNLQVFIFDRTDFFNCRTISSIAPNNLAWNERFRPQESSINKNLTHLTILNVDIEDYAFPINWVDIICHFPNIKKLKLGFLSKSNRLSLHSLEEFLRAVILVRQNCGHHYLAKLVHLDIIEVPRALFHERLPREILHLLRHLAFPLSVLALDIGRNLNEVDRLHLKNTLELHSTSLQSLTVYRGLLSIPFSFYFQLPFLTQLILIGYNPENLHFLNDLPMLKTFVLLDNHSNVGVLNMKKDWLATYSGIKFGWAFERDLVPRFLENTNFSRNFRGVILPNLQTLVFGTQVVDWTQIKSLAKLMPNIKTLQLGMGNYGFIKVCRHWSQIEHIHVEPMDIDEDGILGFKGGEQYRLPNITDLKCLKSISLGYSSQQLIRLSRNFADDDGAAAVLLPNLEAALHGRNVEVYRQPPTVATSRAESDDSD
ncbi:unnamed protein product [Orchesella dallaii]|uniref:F-box domain-containing protein n=1 Tax=Orchesella dallaii TaxID=48710 RepID=A0ABP1QC25_9HEXA